MLPYLHSQLDLSGFLRKLELSAETGRAQKVDQSNVLG